MSYRAMFCDSGTRGAPLLSKLGNLSIREILVVTSAYVPRPYRLCGRGGSKTTRRGGEVLGGKPRGAFGKPVFFLAGNRMTTVALKERFFKSLACLAKRFSSTEVKFRI